MKQPKVRANIRLQLGTICQLKDMFPEFETLRKHKFTITDPGRFFNPDYKHGRWDGTYTFLSRDGRFRIGLLAEMLAHLRRLNYQVKLEGLQHYKGLAFDWSLLDTDYMRKYQVATIRRMAKRIVGPIILPTSAGKSEIMFEFAKICGAARILYLCRTQILVRQTARRAADYLQERVGVVGAGLRDWKDCRFVCAIDKSMLNIVEAGHIKADYFDVIFVDECHHIQASTNSAIVHFFKWKRLYGFTGSFPTLERNLVKHWHTRELIGKPIVKIQDKDFDKTHGKSFMPKIYVFRVLSPTTVPPYARFHNIYRFLKNDSSRNNLIAIIAKQLSSGVLITVNHADHGQLILAACQRVGVQAQFIDAKRIPLAARQDALDRLDSGELSCLIATPVIDEGVSKNNIRHIIYAGGWRSEIQLIQRVGRGKRKKDRGPNVLTIWDFADRGHRNCQKNSNDRFTVYNDITDEIKDVSVPVVTSGIHDFLKGVLNGK